jgi:hypothetical protein
MRRVREDRRLLGSSADLPDLWHYALLRQLTESARQQTCARHGTSSHRFRPTRRALVILLSSRRVRRILSSDCKAHPLCRQLNFRAPLPSCRELANPSWSANPHGDADCIVIASLQGCMCSLCAARSHQTLNGKPQAFTITQLKGTHFLIPAQCDPAPLRQEVFLPQIQWRAQLAAARNSGQVCV